MVSNLLLALTFLAALASGLVAGFFFAFSTTVMGALGRQPVASGIATMQSINVVVLNPWFLGIFLGSAIACAVLAIAALLKWHEPGSAFLLAGALLYVVGTFLVTIVFNVPLNDALAAVAPDSPAGAELWARYLRTWTAWNHVRTIAPLLAAACLTIAIVLQARGPAAA
jgi:uncharacterized membrane protein